MVHRNPLAADIEPQRRVLTCIAVAEDIQRGHVQPRPPRGLRKHPRRQPNGCNVRSLRATDAGSHGQTWQQATPPTLARASAKAAGKPRETCVAARPLRHDESVLTCQWTLA